MNATPDSSISVCPTQSVQAEPVEAQRSTSTSSVRTDGGTHSPVPQGRSVTKPSLTLPAPAPLLTRGGWSAFIVALIVVCAVAPVLNLWVPAGSMFHLSDYAVALLGKIMCYAIDRKSVV